MAVEAQQHGQASVELSQSRALNKSLESGSHCGQGQWLCAPLTLEQEHEM